MERRLQHAGFAVEFTLKWRIMQSEGFNRWPDRAIRRDIYTHDLTKLAEFAGLRDDLLAEVQAATQITRMADATKKLGAVFHEPGSDRRTSGAEFLHLLDGLDFGATGAAWAYDIEDDQWRYLLFTPMIDSKGPRWIYERLLRIFARWRFPPELTPLDIVVSSPRDLMFREFRFRSPREWRSRADARTKDLPAGLVGGTIVGSLVIYRMEVWLVDEDTSQSFDDHVQGLRAA